MALGETPWVDGIWAQLAPRLIAAGYDMDRFPAVHSYYPLNVREHGAGNWGVVSPTNTPHVVVKLTTDRSEATLVNLMLGAGAHFPCIGQPPRGLVRYDDVIKLKFEKRLNRDVYVLWRSEVTHVGNAAMNMPEKMPANRICGEAQHYAAGLESVRKQLGDDTKFLDALRTLWPYVRDRRIATREPRVVVELTKRMRAVWDAIELAAADPAMRQVAAGHTFCIERGILLNDVHVENIGKDALPPHDWLISDPGHAVLLDPSIMPFPPMDEV